MPPEYVKVTHKNRVCVRVFIGVNIYVCVYERLRLYCDKKMKGLHRTHEFPTNGVMDVI